MATNECPESYLATLRNAVDEGRVVLPYGWAHLEEARHVGGPPAAVAEGRRKLRLLGELSRNRHLRWVAPLDRPGQGEFREEEVDPLANTGTVAQQSGLWLAKAIEWCVAAWPDRLPGEMRKLSGANVGVLSQLPVQEVNDYLRGVYETQTSERRIRWRTLRHLWRQGYYGTIALSIATMPLWLLRRGPLPTWEEHLRMVLRDNAPESPAAYTGLMWLLDSYGYCPDERKKGRHSGVGRLWDACHASHAATCDYFVTNDRRLGKRAALVYYWQGVATEVVDLTAFVEVLQSRTDT